MALEPQFLDLSSPSPHFSCFFQIVAISVSSRSPGKTLEPGSNPVQFCLHFWRRRAAKQPPSEPRRQRFQRLHGRRDPSTTIPNTAVVTLWSRLRAHFVTHGPQVAFRKASTGGNAPALGQDVLWVLLPRPQSFTASNGEISCQLRRPGAGTVFRLLSDGSAFLDAFAVE